MYICSNLLQFSIVYADTVYIDVIHTNQSWNCLHYCYHFVVRFHHCLSWNCYIYSASTIRYLELYSPHQLLHEYPCTCRWKQYSFKRSPCPSLLNSNLQYAADWIIPWSFLLFWYCPLTFSAGEFFLYFCSARNCLLFCCYTPHKEGRFDEMYPIFDSGTF